MRAMKPRHPAVLASEFLRQNCELAGHAFFMAGRDAELEWPIRPREHLVLALGRQRHDFEVGDRRRTLADRGPDAVRTRIAPADDHHFLALGKNWLDVALRLIAHAAVLLRQKIHREMDALELAAGDWQVAGLLASSGQHDGIVVFDQIIRRDVYADMCIVVEDDALALHLLDAAIDVNLFHLEIGNAVTEQSARFCPAFVDMHLMAGTRELLRARKARRP